MVALKLRKVENSVGLVLPRDPAFQKQMQKAEEIMGRYRNTLRELAK